MSCGEGAPCLHSNESHGRHIINICHVEARLRRRPIQGDGRYLGIGVGEGIHSGARVWSSSTLATANQAPRISQHGDCWTRRALDIFDTEFEVLRNCRCAACSYPHHGLNNKLCLTCSLLSYIFWGLQCTQCPELIKDLPFCGAGQSHHAWGGGGAR